MRRLALLAAFIASLVPQTVQADSIANAFGLRLGFHPCYFEIPARPELVNRTRMVIVQPGFWEADLRMSDYVPIDSRGIYFHRRPRGDGQPETGPRADRYDRVWHEPIYIKVIEPQVVDPGRAVLLRSDSCWPNK